MHSLKGCVIISLIVAGLGQESKDGRICSRGYCVSKSLCFNHTHMHDREMARSKLRVSIRSSDECDDYLLECCPIDLSPPADDALEDSVDFPHQTSCGQANVNGLAFDFVHNDTVAQYAEYPWVVYILTAVEQSSMDRTSFVCGGSLIHSQFVVTTAHNTEGKTKLIARFGEWDSGTTNEPFPHKEVAVKEIIKHPEYVRNPIANDIALLLLSEKVQYTKHIQPICLSQGTEDFVGSHCISNGWGTAEGLYATIMKKVSLPVLSRQECTKMLRYAGLGPRFNLKEGFMCAGGEQNVDMCKGDGGSPLACQTEDGSFVLSGIVSWGIGCGGFSRPGVYVDVAKYYHWITECVMENDINSLFS